MKPGRDTHGDAACQIIASGRIAEGDLRASVSVEGSDPYERRNRYPTFLTVRRCRGFEGSSSNLRRSS
jgi:hypothetical protein